MKTEFENPEKKPELGNLQKKTDHCWIIQPRELPININNNFNPAPQPSSSVVSGLRDLLQGLGTGVEPQVLKDNTSQSSNTSPWIPHQSNPLDTLIGEIH